eukprot:6105516-Prymnesium_polylepis.1
MWARQDCSCTDLLRLVCALPSNGCLSYAFTPTDGVVVWGADVGRSMHTRLAEIAQSCRDTQDVWEISRA